MRFAEKFQQGRETVRAAQGLPPLPPVETTRRACRLHGTRFLGCPLDLIEAEVEQATPKIRGLVPLPSRGFR
jgi:hypothetical protein